MQAMESAQKRGSFYGKENPNAYLFTKRYVETGFPGGFGYCRGDPGTYAAAARGGACEMGIRMALGACPWDVAWPPGYPPVAQPRSIRWRP